MKMKEIREMSDDALQVKAKDLERELSIEKGSASAASGKAPSPGKIKTLRRTIARMLTVLTQRTSQASQKTETKTSKSERAVTKKNKGVKQKELKQGVKQKRLKQEVVKDG
jgi:large subunit ribosomal protein L29